MGTTVAAGAIPSSAVIDSHTAGGGAVGRSASVIERAEDTTAVSWSSRLWQRAHC